MVLAVSTALTLLYSIIVFLIIILLLVVMLLFARDKLIPKGDVKLTINDMELVVSPGSTLLSTLSSNGVFLPSACGGGGTCGCVNARSSREADQYFQPKQASLQGKNNRMTGDSDARSRSENHLR